MNFNQIVQLIINLLILAEMATLLISKMLPNWNGMDMEYQKIVFKIKNLKFNTKTNIILLTNSPCIFFLFCFFSGCLLNEIFFFYLFCTPLFLLPILIPSSIFPPQKKLQPKLNLSFFFFYILSYCGFVLHILYISIILVKLHKKINNLYHFILPLSQTFPRLLNSVANI